MTDRDPPQNHLSTSQVMALLGVGRQQVINLIHQEKLTGHYEAMPRPGRYFIKMDEKLERQVIERTAKRAAKGAGAELQTRAEYAEIAQQNVSRVLARLDDLIEQMRRNPDLIVDAINAQKDEFVKIVNESAQEIITRQRMNSERLQEIAIGIQAVSEAVQYFREQSEEDTKDRQESLRLQRQLLAALTLSRREPWYRRWFNLRPQDEPEAENQHSS